MLKSSPLYHRALLLLTFCFVALTRTEVSVIAQSDGSPIVHEYFNLQTEKLHLETRRLLEDESSWNSNREVYRQQLHEMLGLTPERERTPLNAVTTGTIDHPQFTVERIHFQSSPGLYVTGNLYLPKDNTERKPTVLYVCGHSRVAKDGVSYGNKTAYQHHGVWLARNGYVCLIIDSLQLGEIEGLHHGTYNLGMWWWVARGYTPAGVEAWNCIRALDYLETRPEVDRTRIGVTGRSGGGAYSWWVSALDDRIQCAIPVAGITNLKNYVVDGCIEGHCDCMFHVNTYRWDFGMIPALVSPKPLLIANTDNDSIFPLDGVVDLYQQTVLRYNTPQLRDKLGLNITFGPHKDTPDLQAHAFSWINRHLGGHEKVVQLEQVESLFTPEQLRVFTELPTDSINRKVHESFVSIADPSPIPTNLSEWTDLSKRWNEVLRNKVFRAWDIPQQSPALTRLSGISNADGSWVIETYQYTSEAPFKLPIYVLRPVKNVAKKMIVHVANEQTGASLESIVSSESVSPASRLNSFREISFGSTPSHEDEMHAWIIPRGIGPTKWGKDERDRTQIRRRFSLLGATDDGQRAFDVLTGLRALQSQAHWQNHKMRFEAIGDGDAASWLLYAVALEPHQNDALDRVVLQDITTSHATGPLFMNILKYLDVPQAIALAANRVPITLRTTNPTAFDYAKQIANTLLPPNRLTIETTK